MVSVLIYLKFCAIFVSMLKKIIVISLLGLYLVFLFFPGWPLLNYYFFSSHNQELSINQHLHFQNNETSHVGDGVYLKALMDRVNGNDISKKAQNPPPRTNTESNTLIYNLPDGFLQSLSALSGIPVHFAHYTEKILVSYGRVLLPPPNLV
jgi:hypothetical protein